MDSINYIRFEINTHNLGLKDSVIRLYPLPCFHVGAPQSDATFIEQHIKRIKEDPNARWVYMGDGGECVVLGSKGNLYEQILNPQQQIDLLLHLFNPIKDKGLFAIRGNHGHRVYKQTGLSFDKTFASNMGIPYMGVNTFCNFNINRSSYNLWFHHGIDSGVTIQSKVNKAEHFGKFINVDAMFTAHSHVAMDLPPAHLLECNNHERRVETKLRYEYICGSGYDSRTGYAVEKGYPPLLPSFIVVELSGKRIQGRPQHKQSSQIFRSDGQHKVNGIYSWMPPLTIGE